MAYPWNLFVSPDTGQPLKSDTAGARLVTEDGAEGWPIVNDIPDFVRREEPDRFGEQARKERWVVRNWQGQQTRDRSDPLARFGREIAEAGGVILEIAAGPGGGNVPDILRADDGASVLVNDLSRMILEDWQQVLRAAGVGPNVAFAAFDACSMPLRPNSIDVAASHGGISNIPGYPRAVKEIHRVLRPGGQLFSLDLVVHREDWSKLPADVRSKWEASSPGLTRGFEMLFAEHGFRVLRSDWLWQRALDPNEGGLPQEADRYGVRLRVTINIVVASKPGG
jgi:SAM-dependent methyltransferase